MEDINHTLNDMEKERMKIEENAERNKIVEMHTNPSDITSRNFPGFTFVISTTRRFCKAMQQTDH